MPYIAKKRMKVGHDAKQDQPVFIEFGQPISVEGWDWRTVEAYARGGLIERIAEPIPAEPIPAAPPARGRK